MSKTVVSLFSGIGGIDLGFIQAGFDVVWANESDKYACRTYSHNFGSNTLVEGDIRSINASNIPQADIIAAGFPCQSFSVMGYRRGFDDPRGNLFFEIARIADTMKPKIIFLENVRNLIYHDNGKTFITIHNTLAGMGYGLKYSVLNASTHGNIPQDRKRTFIVAFRDYDMMNAFSFPDKTALTCGIEDIIGRSVRHSDIYYYGTDNKYYDILNSKIPDKTGIYRIDDSGVANRKYIISPTLKANMGTYPDRVPIIRDDFGIRKLTPYECLALQGFPKAYVFKKIPLEAAYKQMGYNWFFYIYIIIPLFKYVSLNFRRLDYAE